MQPLPLMPLQLFHGSFRVRSTCATAAKESRRKVRRGHGGSSVQEAGVRNFPILKFPLLTGEGQGGGDFRGESPPHSKFVIKEIT